MNTARAGGQPPFRSLRPDLLLGLAGALALWLWLAAFAQVGR